MVRRVCVHLGCNSTFKLRRGLVLMLVLSRKTDERIIIADIITIMVVEIRGDKVRLGIDAPKHITAHRQEVWLEIQKEKSKCAKTTSTPGSDGGLCHPPDIL